MTEKEMLNSLQSIILQATSIYKAIARAPALTFVKNLDSPSDCELKKIAPPFRIQRRIQRTA